MNRKGAGPSVTEHPAVISLLIPCYHCGRLSSPNVTIQYIPSRMFLPCEAGTPARRRMGALLSWETLPSAKAGSTCDDSSSGIMHLLRLSNKRWELSTWASWGNSLWKASHHIRRKLNNFLERLRVAFRWCLSWGSRWQLTTMTRWTLAKFQTS